MPNTKPKKRKHPYDRYKSSQLWKVVDAAIEDLVENNDLSEGTRREYIVGYLCKKIWPELSNKQV
jgi:hypothetical protein